MGRYVFKLPDIGEGTAEAELVTWHVAIGDRVKEEQPLADVMTDKATMEIPAPVSGTVIELAGVPGEMLAVGSDLIVFEVDGSGKCRHVGGSCYSATRGGKACDAGDRPGCDGA